MRYTDRRFPTVILVGAVSWDGARLAWNSEDLVSYLWHFPAQSTRHSRYIVSDQEDAQDEKAWLFGAESLLTSAGHMPLSASPLDIRAFAREAGARFLFVTGSPDYGARWLADGCVDRVAQLHIPIIVGTKADSYAGLVAPFQPLHDMHRIEAKLVRSYHLRKAADGAEPLLLTYHSLSTNYPANAVAPAARIPSP